MIGRETCLSPLSVQQLSLHVQTHLTFLFNLPILRRHVGPPYRLLLKNDQKFVLSKCLCPVPTLAEPFSVLLPFKIVR